MVDPCSARFISSLVKSLQMFCHGYMEFEDTIEIIGHINLRIDNRQKLDYIVNEQVSKQGQESTCFQSNSYHSLPPKSSDRDQHSGRAGDANLHHTVDASLAVLGGTRVQVDLSGPSPVTRSTFSSYHDGFLTPFGNSQTYCQSRESPALEMVQTPSSGLKDSTSVTPGDVLNHTHTKQISCSGNADRTGMELDISVAVSSDPDGQMQNSGYLQDVVIKAEPGALISPEKCGNSDSVGTPGLMDTSSCSVSAGQPASLSTSLAHSYASSLPSLALTLPAVSFDASSVPSQDTAPTSAGDGRQEQVLMCTVGSSGSSLIPVAASLKPALSVIKQDLIVLSQETVPPPVQDLTVPANTSTDKVEDSYPVLSSSSPVVKKQKLEGCQCVVCGTQFRNSKLLGMHMRLVHRKMPHVKIQRKSAPDSDVQTPILSSSSALLAYVRARNEEKRLGKSADLQISTSSVSELTKSSNGSSDAVKVPEISVQRDSDGNGPAACCFCQILFWNHQDLSEHQKLCGQKYNTESSKGQSLGACQTCQLVFPDAALLAEHKKFCVGEVAPAISSPTMCPLCHLSFLDPALLSAHLWVCGKPAASVSNASEPGICESGASAAGSSSSSSSSTVSGNINSCDKCGKVFQGRTSLVDHINSMHKGMSFKCPDCGETFKWRTCVYRHRMRCCKGKNAARQNKDNSKS